MLPDPELVNVTVAVPVSKMPLAELPPKTKGLPMEPPAPTNVPPVLVSTPVVPNGFTAAMTEMPLLMLTAPVMPLVPVNTHVAPEVLSTTPEPIFREPTVLLPVEVPWKLIWVLAPVTVPMSRTPELGWNVGTPPAATVTEPKEIVPEPAVTFGPEFTTSAKVPMLRLPSTWLMPVPEEARSDQVVLPTVTTTLLFPEKLVFVAISSTPPVIAMVEVPKAVVLPAIRVPDARVVVPL